MKLPTGEDIKRVIKKHNLQSDQKYRAFRRTHPELRLPSATFVIKMVKNHLGWKWRVSLQKKTPKEWVLIAEKFAKKCGGILPNRGWLQKHGYRTLDNHMARHPELFRHIPQKTINVKVEKHVATAKLLERKHGCVPHCCWLVRNGYQAIYEAKKRHPEEFKGVTWGRATTWGATKR